MGEGVRYEMADGGVAVIRLDRPGALNALRQCDVQRLIEILDRTAHDADVRSVVLTGTGRAFSAGIDLKELAHEVDKPPHERRPRVEIIQTLTRRLTQHPKIIIAAVNGIAVGLGAELTVAADIRLAAETATFTFPEVKRAVFATTGTTFLLPRLVGSGRAMHWLATGDTVSAAEALAAGLVTGVFAPDSLLEAALGCAERVAANAPMAVRLVKEALRHSPGADLEAMLAWEVEGTLGCMETDDFAEGMQAFLEKRAPRYFS